jgi:hypothetical protein
MIGALRVHVKVDKLTRSQNWKWEPITLDEWNFRVVFFFFMK